ncbi:hypothetical protein DVH24_032610 [Malus domestica]|uniref:Proteasome alpha-type subunits domain-containing protein n=1 Tax=Malus domestica TaxID=3750 RepID=A0A498J8W0_MALDO|nr:hypothetical protein DVH24_032610 [Malus domestica]
MIAGQQSFPLRVVSTKLSMQWRPLGMRVAIGRLSKDGVVLVGEKKVTSKLLQSSTSTEKMYMIDDHVACTVAGIMSDANILINTARVQAQRYMFAYQEPMPVE